MNFINENDENGKETRMIVRRREEEEEEEKKREEKRRRRKKRKTPLKWLPLTRFLLDKRLTPFSSDMEDGSTRVPFLLRTRGRGGKGREGKGMNK